MERWFGASTILEMANMEELKSEQEAFNELTFYTLSHGDRSFIHQNVVDAYAAQYANESSKAITVAFALIGLYLSVEKGYTGKEVQNAHMKLARKRKQWPRFELPINTGSINVFDVIQSPVGPERDSVIRKWCAAVWQSWSESHKKIADLARAELGWIRS